MDTIQNQYNRQPQVCQLRDPNRPHIDLLRAWQPQACQIRDPNRRQVDLLRARQPQAYQIRDPNRPHTDLLKVQLHADNLRLKIRRLKQPIHLWMTITRKDDQALQARMQNPAVDL